MYSQNQNPTKLPFKVLATNDVIEKETIEIEKMGKCYFYLAITRFLSVLSATFLSSL